MPHHRRENSSSSSVLEPCGDGCYSVTVTSSGSCSNSSKSSSLSPFCPPKSRCCPPIPCPPYPNPEAGYSFRTIFTPVNSLHPVNNPSEDRVQFLFRRKNRTVTLQWEPFSGIIGANGISYIAATQGVSDMPPYAVEKVIRISYNSVIKATTIQINPNEAEQIRFYLDLSNSGVGTAIGDTFIIYGGEITWILDSRS